MAFVTMKPSCNSEAVEVLFTIPSTTADINELMSREHVQQKLNCCHAIYIAVRYTLADKVFFFEEIKGKRW